MFCPTSDSCHLPLQTEEQIERLRVAGRGGDRSPDSPMITFCSGPVAGKEEEDQASATEYEFYICNAAERYLHVTASRPELKAKC